MGFAHTRLAAVCGTFAVLLSCTETQSEPSAPAPPLGPDPFHATPHAAGLDAALMDATAPAAMDASRPRLDGALDTPDTGGDVAPEAATDARAPFLGEARLEVLTKPVGRYQPTHLLVIWIEDEAGTPVKVIGRWAGAFQRYLTTFNERVPDAFGGGLFGPRDGSVPIGQLDPDVITSPTLRAHEPQELTWDLTDYAGNPVPDATYFIYIEANDDNFESSLAVIEMRKGPEPMTAEQGESERFAYVRVSYTPPEP